MAWALQAAPLSPLRPRQHSGTFHRQPASHLRAPAQRIRKGVRGEPQGSGPITEDTEKTGLDHVPLGFDFLFLVSYGKMLGHLFEIFLVS